MILISRRDDNLEQQDLENELLYIVESKQKCINAGMDPNEFTFSKVVLSDQELANKKLAYEEILEVVGFFGNKILKSLEGTPMVVTISDEKGTILEMIGNEVMISSMSQLGVKPGVRFSQEDMGTNVISLTLQQNHPVQLIGDNHYHTFLHNSACYGV
jgi:transcriptional regulator of acetoin/glycerol metabolism